MKRPAVCLSEYIRDMNLRQAHSRPYAIPELVDLYDPSFRCLDPAHLDAGQRIIQALHDRAHLLHAIREHKFLAVVVNFSDRGDDKGADKGACGKLWTAQRAQARQSGYLFCA